MLTSRSKLIVSLALANNDENGHLQEPATETKTGPINTNYCDFETHNSRSDYVLHELQPVNFPFIDKSVNNRGFVKLDRSCTITSNQKVITWLSSSYAAEPETESTNASTSIPYLQVTDQDQCLHINDGNLMNFPEDGNLLPQLIHGPVEDNDNVEILVVDQTGTTSDIQLKNGTQLFSSLEETGYDSEDIPLIQLKNKQLIANTTAANLVDNEVTYTKAGTIRKRKKYDTDLKTRNLMKQIKLAEAHVVLPGCKISCKKKCSSLISEQLRKNINKEFWKISNKERRTYLLNTCKRLQVKRRTTESSRKQNTFKYLMTKEGGETVEVCKTFLLTTLGYKKNNDRVLHDTLSKTPKGQLVALAHGRLGKPSNRKIDDEDINAHIESFNPCVSHYRRVHAPNTRYLSSDITVTLMYNDFQEKYPNTKLSYETYRKKIKAKRLSFTKLGHEECDICETFKLHEHNENNIKDSCVTCVSWKKHITRAKESRRLYTEQAGSSFDANRVCVSADLQKIIMLPRIDMFKRVIFLKRLIAYNETFVPVGKLSRKNKPYAIVWHEAISKRSKEDLISTFYAFFKYQRDTANIIIWLDNCASQNKNWTLFTFLIRMVNSNEISATNITFNYFEPGHTFMSADSFHHQVELSMKRKQKIYDFDDFSDAVGSACKGNVDIKKMEPGDFYNWKNFTSVQKLKKDSNNRPYLSDIVQVIFERGHYTLKYRTSFSEETTKTLDFLMKKAMKKSELLKTVACLDGPHGFPKDKKETILKELNGVLPENRKEFWKNLPPTTTPNEDYEDNVDVL